MAFVLAVDGYGPFNGWLLFLSIMFVVVVIGGVLGLVGRRMDMSDQGEAGTGDGPGR